METRSRYLAKLGSILSLKKPFSLKEDLSATIKLNTTPAAHISLNGYLQSFSLGFIIEYASGNFSGIV